MNYEQLAFTDAIKQLQEEHGSRKAYARMELKDERLGEEEFEFIATRDTFYIASIGENGYPYIQHRGGPKGFLKVLDAQTLGMLDFTGNRQYITVGNVRTNPRISMILMDYPMQARMKIYAEMRVQALDADPALYDRLAPNDYPFRAERILLFDIKGFSWNCQQHIVPRYTVEEIEQAFAGRNAYVSQLEEEVQRLRAGAKKS
jgi:predicted pyridoxine 5'-phosphate oxidase superfamily flavin-nucleotide-binding protein